MNEKPVILVVDDEPSILNYIKISLQHRGYGILTAESGEAAVDVALRDRPDLILMDVNLPGIDGMEACRQIKSRYGGFIPVILVTVQRDLRDKVAGMNHGADDYLTKPFVMEELQTRVMSMLRIKKLYDDQEKASVTDTLTGAYNRRYFQVRLKEECDRSLRYAKTFTSLMLDIDFFKKLNDTYGHLFGDEILREFAAFVRGLIRKTDILVRYGGEEFVVILPETPLEEGRKIAEMLRMSVERHNFPDSQRPVPLTCSIGVCGFPSTGITDFTELLKKMDDALYTAKRGGRNRVVVHDAPQNDLGVPRIFN